MMIKMFTLAITTILVKGGLEIISPEQLRNNVSDEMDGKGFVSYSISTFGEFLYS